MPTSTPASAIVLMVSVMPHTTVLAVTEICHDDHTECYYIADDDCDDGGPGYHYTSCSYGTDCTDCGSRCPYFHERPDGEDGDCVACSRPGVATFKRVKSETCVIETCAEGLTLNGLHTECVEGWTDTPGCNNDCSYAHNGYCGDGGSGSSWYQSCALGSDCADCQETREVPECGNKEEMKFDGSGCKACERYNATEFADAPGCNITQCDPQYELHIRHDETGRGIICDPAPLGPGCTHTCEYADNDRCEDGGPDHYWWRGDRCELGTDCGDCGVRVIKECDNKMEQSHEGTEAICVDCEREQAAEFEDMPGCVIKTCNPNYYVRSDGTHCDEYPEGLGCEHHCLYADNGYCEDGTGWGWANCEIGEDCGDCGLSCPHGYEVNISTNVTCIECARPGAVAFDNHVAAKCHISECRRGYELRPDPVPERSCVATVQSCLIDVVGHEMTDDGLCLPCSAEGVKTYQAATNGCVIEACNASYWFDAGEKKCILKTAEPTGQPDADAGKANEDDSGFNPLLLLLLLIPVLLLIGVAAFFMTKKKKGGGSSSSGDKEDTQTELIPVEEQATAAPEDPADAAEDL